MVRKRFLRRVLPNVRVTIAGGTAGFFVSGVSGPVGGVVAAKASEEALRWTIGQFCDIFRGFEGTIFDRQLGGRDKLEYRSVAHFWTKIEPDLALLLTGQRHKGRHTHDFWEVLGMPEEYKRRFAIPIIITGLVSPYGPLTPAHPMSRPGYSVDGWENLGELEVGDTETYDVRDALIYGDRVLRLTHPKDGNYYGGIYDAEFGISNVSIPFLQTKEF